jgi:Ammonia permease
VSHNYPLATIVVFPLWFGWFGINGCSVLSATPGKLSLVFMTTALAGASGLLGSMIVSWSISKKPDLGMTLNGALAGLVGITAGADQMNFAESLVIGFIAGVFVVFSIKLFDKLKVDDPVGAISVHLVCGIWGTLAVGLFGDLASPGQLLSQVKGILIVALLTFGVSWVLFKLIDLFIGLRVSKEEEEEGLDLGEHYESAYCFAPESISVLNKDDSREQRLLKQVSKNRLKHVNVGRDLQDEDRTTSH